MFSLLTLFKFHYNHFLTLLPSLYLPSSTPSVLNPTLFIWCLYLLQLSMAGDTCILAGWSHFKFMTVIFSSGLLVLPSNPVTFPLS